VLKLAKELTGHRLWCTL